MITRDNYEEFFLLYVDNELSAEDRVAVERFAAGDPGLEEELRSLLGCRLKPEGNLSFGDPGALMKREPVPEELLSYIDGELDESGRKAVEARVQEDPSLLRELGLLRQTVSIPDPLVMFPDKQVLYRRSARVRVFGLPPTFFRVAAAAVIIVAVGLLVLTRTNRTGKSTDPSLVISKAGNTQIPAAPVADRPSAGGSAAARPGATKAHTASPVAPSPIGSSSVTTSLAVVQGTRQAGSARNPDKDNKNDRRTVTPRTPVALYSKAAVRREVADNRGAANIDVPDPGLKDQPANGSLASMAMVTTGDQQAENRELSSFATQALLKEA
ncbi:MAG TPA: hypothetical protein VE035_05680, partial [Puia sp.]|nr:hypothetical protein [Puia sp.]